MDTTVNEPTLEALKDELGATLVAIRQARRACRRLMTTSGSCGRPEIQQRVRAGTRGLYDAERAIVSVLSGADFDPDQSAHLYWVHPATRQTEVLELLRELGEASATEIGEHLGLHRSRVIAICHRLTRRGFLRVRRDPDYRGRKFLFSAISESNS